MSSGPPEAPAGHRLPDDRTAKARIRDAAITCFGRDGTAATTARRVAAAAGVSPGLVIHHFGSMDGLRAACDEHVAAVIRRDREAAMTAGPQGFDLLAALRDSPLPAVSAYLARVLTDDAPAVAKLVDELVADAEHYLRQGVESRMLRPTADLRARAAVLVVWSLGALVLHGHVDRLLGADLLDPDGGADALLPYARPASEILAEGVFTPALAARLRDPLPPEGPPTT